MALSFPAAAATSTSAANSARFRAMLMWARSARPAQPVSLGMSSRFPTSFISPTWVKAPVTATSTCTTVSAAAHTSRFNSGLIAPPCCRTATPNAAGNRGGLSFDSSLSVQAAHAEGDILARQRGEVQIDAQDLLRPVGRLECERQRHAQLGPDDRQIRPRDLYLARGLDRASEIRLGLPVRPLGGLDHLEALVQRMDLALGFDVRADLQAVAADEVAALRAG